MQVLKITAADIDALLRTQNHGPLEIVLLEHLAIAKNDTRGALLLVRVDFPGEPDGGIEFRCKRWREGSVWVAVLWWLAGGPVRWWREG